MLYDCFVTGLCGFFIFYTMKKTVVLVITSIERPFCVCYNKLKKQSWNVRDA